MTKRLARAVRQERLRQLRRVVEGVPDHSLIMDTFKAQTSCGAVYCAAGWAACDAWFNSQGFRFYGDDIEYGEHSNGEAVEAFFGKSDNTCRLFGFDGYHVSPCARVPQGAVIENIDRMLSGRKPLPYHKYDV